MQSSDIANKTKMNMSEVVVVVVRRRGAGLFFDVVGEGTGVCSVPDDGSDGGGGRNEDNTL